MATKKTTAKTAVKGKAVVRSNDDQAISQALNGEYNTIIPLNGGLNAYVRHPLNGRTVHCATRSDKFVALLREMRTLGIGDRIDRELEQMATNSNAWAEALAYVREAETQLSAAGTDV